MNTILTVLAPVDPTMPSAGPSIMHLAPHVIYEGPTYIQCRPCLPNHSLSSPCHPPLLSLPHAGRSTTPSSSIAPATRQPLSFLPRGSNSLACTSFVSLASSDVFSQMLGPVPLLASASLAPHPPSLRLLHVARCLPTAVPYARLHAINGSSMSPPLTAPCWSGAAPLAPPCCHTPP
jgi:hypothetical protein